MNFPGDNEIRLSHATVLKIIGEHLRSLIGDDARIVSIASTSSYSSSSGMTIDFTTDPPPPPREPAPADAIATPTRGAQDEPL
jgi:hypothetical protein